MALLSLRLRRALTTVSSLNRSLSLTSSTTPKPDPTTISAPYTFLARQSASERSGPPTRWAVVSARLYSTKQYKLYKEGDEITPDTVLFEGCDYNHWLITMDFPKENPPSREDMIATYEQTCAKGLGISLEEAKKRMYACSTTTYQGFQAIMTEEESEKFREIAGVVFILPDSYIDPVNKEYGGDKYENGVITPRPPPVQYGRSRPRDRNRSFDQPRYGQGSPSQNYQGNSQYRQQGPPMQGDGRGYGPPQYPDRQNYGPPGHGERRGPVPQFQGNSNQEGQGSPVPPPSQGNYNQVPQGNYNQSPQGNYNQVPQGNYNQGPQGNYNQGLQGNYNQVPQGNYNQVPQGNYNQGPQGNYNPQGGSGNYTPTQGGNYGQVGNPGYGQGYSGHGQGQGQAFPQGDPRNVTGDWRNNNSIGQTGTDQGRH